MCSKGWEHDTHGASCVKERYFKCMFRKPLGVQGDMVLQFGDEEEEVTYFMMNIGA